MGFHRRGGLFEEGGGSDNIFVRIFKALNRFISSELGGLVISQLSAAQFQKLWDDFKLEVDKNTRAQMDIIEGQLGVGTSTGESAIQTAVNLAQEVGTLGGENLNPDQALARFNELTGSGREVFTDLPGQVAAGNVATQAFFSNLREEQRTGATDINRRFGESLTTARGLVSTLGGQERVDINRAFTESGIAQQQNLAARGLGSSTIRSSIASGVERERTDALGRLQDRLTRQQLGVEATFGLSGLSARERLLGAGINVGTIQGGAAQAGNVLAANVGLGVGTGLANIGAQGTQTFDAAALNQILVKQGLGQDVIDTILRASGLALDSFGRGQLLIAPSPNLN